MKNQILTALDANGKYSAFLYRYEETPSESVRPILMISSAPVFETAKVAAWHLFNRLKPEVKANTEVVEEVQAA